MTNIKQKNKNRMIELAMASKGVTAEQIANMSNDEITERRIPLYIVNHAKNSITTEAIDEEVVVENDESTEQVAALAEEPTESTVMVDAIVEAQSVEVTESVVAEPVVQEESNTVGTTDSELRDLTADETAKLLEAYAAAGSTTLKKLLLVAKTVLGDEVEKISTTSITSVTRAYIDGAKAK